MKGFCGQAQVGEGQVPPKCGDPAARNVRAGLWLAPLEVPAAYAQAQTEIGTTELGQRANGRPDKTPIQTGGSIFWMRAR